MSDPVKYASFGEALLLLGACRRGILWAADYPDARTAWRECTNPEDLYWLVASLKVRWLLDAPCLDFADTCAQIRSLVQEDDVIRAMLKIRGLRLYDSPGDCLQREPGEMRRGDRARDSLGLVGVFQHRDLCGIYMARGLGERRELFPYPVRS